MLEDKSGFLIFTLHDSKPMVMNTCCRFVIKSIAIIVLSMFVVSQNESYGQLSAPYNLEVWMEYGTPNHLNATWECEPDTIGFQFYVVKINGNVVGTSTSQGSTWSSSSPTGTICVSVAAFYDHGTSDEITDCVTWGASHISIEPNFHEAYLNPDDTLVHYVNIKNSGSTDLSFSFPGFDTGNPPPGFITEVSPAYGIISPDSMEYIAISWDAAGYTYPGDEQDLILNSSDATLPVSTISNSMAVLDRIYVVGHVYDSQTNLPINGAAIGPLYYYPDYNPSAKSLSDGSYVYMTSMSNYYYIKIKCNKHAYYTGIDSIAPNIYNPGDTVLMDFYLTALPYPVDFVHTELQACDVSSGANVSWTFPVGEEEIIYDDGIAEDYFCWTNANSENAVRVTPIAYPVKLTGGCVYVGEGLYPGAYWLYREFSMLVYDEGPGNMPGSLLDSIGVLIYHHGWITFSGLDAQIDSGDFFISMKQINPFPNTAPIGIDNTIPVEGRSYQRASGGTWSLSAYQDFMIRPIIDGPSFLGGVQYYTVARVSDFDPQAGPETGTITPLTNISTLFYYDNSFQLLPETWYAYAIQPSYVTGQVAPWTFSNIVGQNIGNTVTFIISDCLLGPAEGFMVTAEGQDWPFESKVEITDSDGICVFECIWTGNWEYTISKCGYEDYEFTGYVDQDITYEIIMNNKLYEPRNLGVDSASGMASWDEPMITALLDDFDEMDIYANGWQMTTNGNGWIQTDDGGSTGFFIPPIGSTYVCVNDNAGGPGNDGCCDMLITPELDLCEADDYVLNFDSYFTGVLGQTASVKYSVDSGQNWTVIYTLSPAAGVWEHIQIDLAAISGNNTFESIFIAFHADDGGGVASGWAIDNIDINAGHTDPVSYFVYLDGAFISTVDTTHFLYPGLSYGQIYVSGVAAFYDCGMSGLTYELFTAGYLAPPSLLEADTLANSVELLWIYDTASIPGIMPDVLGFNVYRDSINMAFVPYTGEDTNYYNDIVPDPMCYDYHVSTIYDISLYGNPGDTGESQYTGPEEVCLVFGPVLPFGENWDSGSFGSFWIPEDNWVVNGQMGNPEPAAEFMWNPILSDYTACLTSGAINGVFPLTKNDPYSDGKFILSFDLKLDNVNPTGNELFKAEIWSEGVWHKVSQYNNANGNIYWETVEVDITEYSMGKVFKIRFMAIGEESSDILSWFVDNIEVYHYCAPVTLEWEPTGIDTCLMYWEAPVYSKRIEEYLNFGTNTDLTREVLGYNIFWKMDNEPYSFLDYTTDTFYAFQLPLYDHDYWFYVTAIYESCESAESNQIWVPFPPPPGIDENDIKTTIKVYPNPINDIVNIESSARITQICLLDYSGRMMQCIELQNQDHSSMDILSYKAGIYLLRIDTEEGRFVRKIVVTE